MATSIIVHTNKIGKWILDLIDIQNLGRKFHGKIALSFEKGELTYVKKEQGIYPPKEL